MSTTFKVTAVTAGDGQSVAGLELSRAQVRAALLGGVGRFSRVAVAAGYSELWCEVCGERAHNCPELSAVLPAEFVNGRQAAEQEEVA